MSRKTTAYGRKLARQQTMPADPFAMQRVFNGLLPFTERELTALKMPPRVAFESLRRGQGSEADFHTLACVANNTLVCAEAIHADCVEVARCGQDALVRMLERHHRLGKWGLDSQALQDVPPLLELHEQLLELYTPRQMQEAMTETQRRMRAGQTLAPEACAA